MAAPATSAPVKKQGAYGKVRVHTESLLSQAAHLDEVCVGIAYKLGLLSVSRVTPLPASSPSDLLYCERMLGKVSRSFAVVIQQLPAHLRTAVCIFYLVLRGLDTVEDDMTAFQPNRQDEKLALLRTFYVVALDDPAFALTGVGEGDERALLESFGCVSRSFLALHPADRAVIRDITARMGEGMAQFATRDLGSGTRDVADYNLYCHYVAGLVGEGLSRLWVAHGDEAPLVSKDVRLADDMGVFLQKVNIIRDYCEDLEDGRAFWPEDIWSQYAPHLSCFREWVGGGSTTPEGMDASIACLNHLVADALQLAPSCLRYLERLQQRDIFAFCAIPQVMAIATLSSLVSNPLVFTGVVKLRKGQALLLMSTVQGRGDGSKRPCMRSVLTTFLKHARAIRNAIPLHHKAAAEIATAACSAVEATCLLGLERSAPSASCGNVLALVERATSPYVTLTIMGVAVALLAHLHTRSAAWGDGDARAMPRITDSLDVAAVAGVAACLLWCFAAAALPSALALYGGGGGRRPPSSRPEPKAVSCAGTGILPLGCSSDSESELDAADCDPE